MRAINALNSFAISDPTTQPDLSEIDYEKDINRVATLAELEFLADPDNGSAEDIDKKYFHDFTTYSYGVLADVKNGGLKKDLSLAFEMEDDDFNKSAFAENGQNMRHIKNMV